MSTSSSAGARFRAALEAERPLQVVGTINAYTALMAKKVGYKAIYLSGGGVAANSLGTPDLGISTMEDVLTDIRRITDACDLPLLVDVDTGWGGAFNIARTVKSLIKFGAAAMHIEDQVAAKRCGHRPGKAIVPKEEMVDRVKAAADARTDDGFVIMARTDALAGEGLEAAIDRAVACVEAGADMIFPEAVQTLEQYEKIKTAVKAPILANITEFGKTPLFTREELAKAGVDIQLLCCGAYRAMNKAALTFYQTVRDEGTQKNIVEIMQTRDELYEFLDYHAYEEKLDELFSQGRAE
ncbi:MAG: methylisocitrate lyase [Gammaproteobacteria bacterium]|nr:methylisocitrate lyase [Gammaproteobacteria bacterium]